MRYRISIYRALVGLVLMPILALAPVTSLEARDATEVALAAPNPAPAALRFGVYAGGGTGETPNAPIPTSTAVLGRLAELAGGQPLNIHLFTAWSWYNPAQLDDQIQHFGAAGFRIILTVKYSPPAGHDGDLPGYENFVRGVVARYGTLPAMDSFVIGNEANVYGNPDASDGPFIHSHAAVVRGVMAARQKLAQMGSSARVGMNFGLTSTDADAGFLSELAQIGGSDFTSSVQFVGMDFYPGLWPAGTGRPYTDMLNGLESARASVDRVTGLRGRAIDVLEVGAPILSEQDQAHRLSLFVQATLNARERLQITSLNWFDLWDADSGSADTFAHYGLLHSDLSPKPAFSAMQRALAANH